MQSSSPSPLPALVFGHGETLLGVLRGLGEARVRAHVAAAPGDFTRWSRWFRVAPGAPLRSGNAQALAEDLARSPLSGAVLLACSDSAAVAVASLPPELRSRFPACCPTAEVQATLADKLRFARVLQRLEIPHPETIEITSREVIADLPDEDPWRYFLKPLDSERFNQRFGIKACLVENKEIALGKYDRLADEGQAVVLQEYIPGLSNQHFFIDGFVDRHGEVRARFARRRIRMYPADFGNSSCMISVPVAEVSDASSSLDRLLADLNFRGIFSAEFKRDPRDGICKLLEVNGRPWWYIGFAQSCGMNMSAMAYRDALGQAVPTVTEYRAGVWCVYPRLDVRAGLAELREGRLRRRDWAASWLRGVKPIFAWTDPAPSVSEFLRLAKCGVEKLFSRTTR